MASVEVMESGEDEFLSQLERARSEMSDRFRAVHELLQEREAALLAEFQELEDRFRGLEIADEMKQLSHSKEQLQNTTKEDTNQEVLQETIAPLESRMKELEMSLEKAKEMRTVDFVWEDSLTEKLKSLGIIQVDVEKRFSKDIEISNYKRKGVPISVFGKHSTKVQDPGNFVFPNSILFNEEKEYVYICDTGYNRVQVFDKSFRFLYLFNEKMIYPAGIIVFQEEIFVTQFIGNCLNVYSQDGDFIRSVGEEGTEELQFKGPRGIAFSTEWKRIYICELENNRIQCLNLDLSFNSFIPEVLQAKDVKLSSDRMVVLCNDNPCIRIYNSTHQISGQIVTRGKGLQVILPGYMCLDENLNILLTDIEARCVLIFSHTGELIHKFGKEGEEKGNFIEPRGITMDSKGRIFVTSENSDHCVQIF